MYFVMYDKAIKHLDRINGEIAKYMNELFTCTL